jgi:hypothetical protein
VARYGFGIPFQVGPEHAVILANIHRKQAPANDFEMGTDAIVFNHLDGITPANAVTVARNHVEMNPRAGAEAEMVKYTSVGGFVPWGASRGDGTPHPHAGTGFGAEFAWAYAVEGDDRSKPYPGAFRGEKEFAFWELRQFAFDGATFSVTRVDRLDVGTAVSGHTLFGGPLHAAIPDGDDLLLAYTAFRPGQEGRGFVDKIGTMVAGMTRWRRGSQGWRPVSFVPATGEIDCIEPSLIRDIYGSLLFSARPAQGDLATSRSVLVWRSRDNGSSWEKIIDIPNLRQPSPVTINQAADGTPYVLCNQSLAAFIATNGTMIDGDGHCSFREILCLWPLNESRTGLLSPHSVRYPRYEFGVPPGGCDWTCDHASGNTIRLADGQVHHLICYRMQAHAEVGGAGTDIPPTPHSGLWVERCITELARSEEWHFAPTAEG